MAPAGAGPLSDAGHAGDTGAGPERHDSGSTSRKDAGAPRPPFDPIRIACGQATPVTDANSNVWSADEDFVGGSADVTPGVVAGTSSPAVYAGQRYGAGSTPFHYSIPVPAGTYSVLLKFDEEYYTNDAGTGSRVFNVSLNGQVVLRDFDIYAAAGNALNTAVDRSFSATVAGDSATLTIALDPVVGDPRVDAIQITQTGATDAGEPPPDGGSPSPRADSGADGGTLPHADAGGDLLAYLKGLNTGTSKRVLAGQHADYWQQNNSNPYGEQLDEFAGTTPANATITTTGKTPAILGTTFDMQYQNVTPAQNLALVNGWLAAGGIAQVSWWAIDPAGGSTNPFPNILSDGDPVNTAWIAELASLAAQLKQVSGTVLFRPFLEMNGNWFWWGVENRTPAQYIQLWQQTHDYLVHTQGLTNLVFVYAVNAGGADSTFTDGYPGPTYVDVVGFDYYGNNPATDCLSTYQTLETLGKPIIIAEGGVDGATGTPAPNSGDNSQFITATKSAMPNIVAIMIWSQGWALDKQNGADAFLTDPWIIDRSGLPAGL